MLRKLVIVSAFVGTAASVPIVYQQNPKALQNLVRAVVEYDSSAPTAEETASVRRDTAPRPAAQVDLTGRKVRLAADDRGHFAGDFKLNGREIPAMIDTGATLVAINETIAKRAGIRQSSFYSHFASREACLAEAATREAELLVQRLGSRRRALRDAPMALRRSREAAVAGLEMALAHLATHDELRALIAMRHAEHAAGDAVRAALARLRDGLVKDLDVFGVVAPRDATMRVELMMALTSEAADGVHEGRYTLDAVVPVLMDQVGALFPRSDTP